MDRLSELHARSLATTSLGVAVLLGTRETLSCALRSRRYEGSKLAEERKKSVNGGATKRIRAVESLLVSRPPLD